jgi:hydrogenase nickel incorporation protein HypA/HybF
VVECRSCGGTSTLDLPILLCAECGSTEVELVSGEEFLIASIDRAKEVC